MNKLLSLLSACVFASCLMLGAGCAGNAKTASSNTSTPVRHEQCLVCKYENDLACVDLDVDATTPHANINGKEYYFCSEHCKNEGIKHPEKYLTQK